MLGLVALERGDVSNGREQLTAGLESAEESGDVRQVAQLHEAMARLETDPDDQAKARRHREQAIEIFERLGDIGRAREIRAQFVE